MDGKQIKNGTITATKLNLTTPVNPNDPATKQFTEDLVTTSGYLQNWKKPVKVFVGVNVNLAAPGATLDGVTMAVNDTFLAGNQTTASQVGSYTWLGASTPATRTPDFDSTAEIIDGSTWVIQQGTFAGKYKKLITDSPIVLGTTSLVVDDFLTFATTNPSVLNKSMAASLTTADNQIGCATALGAIPANDSYLAVYINGERTPVGDGVKTKHCYFSSDSGATAKTIANFATGDIMYWVGSIAGYQLATTDIIDFDYNV